MFDGKPTKIGRVLPIMQPYLGNQLLRQSTLYEEERSLGNWSYDFTA